MQAHAKQTRSNIGRRLTLTILLLLSASPLEAGTFEQHVFRDRTGEHKYAIYFPDGYSQARQWPVVLYLHGAGERGSDGKKQLTAGLGPVLQSRAVNFPFVAVFPQCEEKRGPILSAWEAESPDGRRALAILDEVIEKHSIDRKKQILTGWSMGSFGAVSLAEAVPERWSGVLTVSGGGAPRDPARLAGIPFWIFHGEEDQVVLPAQSRDLASALEQAGGTGRLEILQGEAHYVWKQVYRSNSVIRWMLDPKPNPKYAPPPALPESSPLVTEQLVPFRTAMEIPRAAYVRLGNEMLSALAESVPKMIPEDLLAGSLQNIYDSTTAAGRDFSVVFSNISYSGNVSRTHIESYRKDRLNIQLGLSDVVMRIGRTDVSGSGKSAVAGAIDIVIGHRAPVWLSLAVEPTVVNRKLKLKLIATRFDIPQNNWYVSQPAGVSTRGLGMTRERVVDGLTSGLYGSKGKIEREVEAMGASIIERLESKLAEAGTVTDFMDYLWPLPVYRPRVVMWPESVETDKQGVTILLGLSVAANDPDQAPQMPLVDSSVSLSPADIPPTKDLQVGLSTNLLKPLTEQLIRENVARIHLQDIPGRPFRELEDAETLTKILPESKRLGPNPRFRTEFVMQAPLEIFPAPLSAPRAEEQAAAAELGGVELDLQLDPVILKVSAWDESLESWQPFAEFSIRMAQGIRLNAEYPSFNKREVDLGWSDELEVSIRGTYAEKFRSENSQPDSTEVTRLFQTGWQRWTGKDSSQQVSVPDIKFGNTLFRLSQSGWKTPQMFARFTPPGIKISNNSDRELKYRIRSERSGWSDAITLAPNKSHEFEGVSNFYVFLPDREGTNTFKIPIGSHTAYQPPQAGGPPELFLK